MRDLRIGGSDDVEISSVREPNIESGVGAQIDEAKALVISALHGDRFGVVTQGCIVPTNIVE
jgi:hypothetical protein